MPELAGLTVLMMPEKAPGRPAGMVSGWPCYLGLAVTPWKLDTAQMNIPVAFETAKRRIAVLRTSEPY